MPIKNIGEPSPLLKFEGLPPLSTLSLVVSSTLETRVIMML
ncbi:3103_t:CDS:2 [Paraglomus brasilianum]|uniref:3103_t:CDS:1 n=1 Tax=Paraglomus brasilianum TaxID=144538 RepID=A0A9N9DGR1_9GLOM|nr:3103_t:CDS:2 [Paraglomus brasilianum]